MKVLFAASEALPFIKVGGLGDVMGALPKELNKMGVDARVVIPFYDSIPQDLRQKAKYLKNFNVYLGWRESYCGVFELKQDGVTYYFIDNEMYFKRGNVYGEFDDGERFAFFSKAVVELIRQVDFYPDIIHANDWHTALVPVYLNYFYRFIEGYRNIKTVLSIHNIEFQGKYDPYILGNIFGLDIEAKPVLMYDGCLNLLKGGIESSNVITTVSESYAQEIKDPYFSYGLQNILIPREYKLKGILNGIDTDLYNPETDKYIKTNYSEATKHLKRFNKKDLQECLDLEVNPDKPIIAMVTRLTPQKGLDLVRAVIGRIMELDVQLVILGTGYREYEDFFREWQGIRPDKMRAIIEFSNEWASKIYAGADFFLMPSKSEPCGLAQMIAMRYGTIPIVHTVGGLKDTVTPYNPEEGTGRGITFNSFNADDMFNAIERACGLFSDKQHFLNVKKNAMAGDYSWSKSAKEYVDLYKSI